MNIGGNFTREDFKKYKVITHSDRLMIRLDENFRIIIPPPPSSGVLVAFIMKIMRGI